MNLVFVDVLGGDSALRANRLRSDFGVEIRTVDCDLGPPAPYRALEAAVADIDVDVLVCNYMFTPVDTPASSTCPRRHTAACSTSMPAAPGPGSRRHRRLRCA